MQRRIISQFSYSKRVHCQLSPIFFFASRRTLTLGGEGVDDPLYADVPRPCRRKSERKPYPTPMKILIRRAKEEKEARKAQPSRVWRPRQWFACPWTHRGGSSSLSSPTVTPPWPQKTHWCHSRSTLQVLSCDFSSNLFNGISLIYFVCCLFLWEYIFLFHRQWLQFTWMLIVSYPFSLQI